MSSKAPIGLQKRGDRAIGHPTRKNRRRDYQESGEIDEWLEVANKLTFRAYRRWCLDNYLRPMDRYSFRAKFRLARHRL
jgi:hypothetical protein